jgi:hypothetical protein
VDNGVRHLKDIVRRHARQRWLLAAIREAVEELHRSYVTLAGEVTLLGGAGSSVPLGLERISRSQLVQRIHRTGGDFRLIARWCRELESTADPGLEEAQLVLRRWANRDVHLFRILVPLASFAEELREDVAHAMGASGPSGALLDACLRNAHRAMVPVFRELSMTAGALRQFSREFDSLVPKQVPVVVARHR